MSNEHATSPQIPESAYLEAMTPLLRGVVECSFGIRPYKGHIRRYASSFLEKLREQGALLPSDSDAIKLLGLTLTHHLRHPENPIAWFNVAVALRLIASSCPNDPKEQNNHRLALAVNACLTAVHTNPTAVRCWTELGINLFLLGEADQALIVFEEGLQEKPEDVPLLLWRAFACEALGRCDDALASTQKAQALYIAGAAPEELHYLFQYQSVKEIHDTSVAAIKRSIQRSLGVAD